MISHKKTEIQNKMKRGKSTHGLATANPKKVTLLTGSSIRSNSGNERKNSANICCMLHLVLGPGAPLCDYNEETRTQTALLPYRR